VRIGFNEKKLIETAKAVKGRWNPDVKLWYIRYGKIKGTAYNIGCSVASI
jgi:hypothetical protein